MQEGARGSTQPRVLLVEDEAHIRRGLQDVFRFRGYSVEAVEDGLTGLRRAQQETWDLIVLDIMLPEMSGFTVCERLRESNDDVPVLILTAKGDEDDIVRGFQAGANDYVTKPFGVRELTARVDALLRRSARKLAARFSVGPLQVDPDESSATDGKQVYPLSEREVRILRVMSLNESRIVSRRALLRDAWDMNNAEQLETRTVDVHIAKLRKRLGRHGDLIATVRGQGYRLLVP